MKQDMQIDQELLNLTIPLTQDDQDALEQSLLRDGCRKPIITWRGMILDGHKRHQFCSYEEIEYEMQEMEFPTREEAIIWVCSQRIVGLQKHSAMFRYLVGKWYISKKQVNKKLRKIYGTPELPKTNSREIRNSPWDTSLRMAEELGVHRSTVEGCGEYAKAMDMIAEKEPALFRAILRRDVYFRNLMVIEMAAMDAKKLGEIRKKKLGTKDVKKRRRKKNECIYDGGGRMENKTPIIAGIKEMPAFDPDMELKGLSLTIPAWINAIARAGKRTDMEKATEKAKENLAANLDRLQAEINHMQEVLR